MSGPHVSPVSVGVNKVGAKSWIVVKTVAADPAVRIQLDSCAAVTFPNAQGDPKYDEIQLIEKGCPVSPLVEIISMGSSAAAEFSIRSFQDREKEFARESGPEYIRYRLAVRIVPFY